ncbi:MAG: ribonuclease HII [Patescibacteria group bacterium]
MQIKSYVGIDEAGRGPLAGPVAVGVVVVPGSFDWQSKLPGVTDSKKLSEAKREEFFEMAKHLKKAGELDYTVAMVSAKVIDREGIVRAIARAMARTIKRLKLDPKEVFIKLDGSLKAQREYKQQTIIKGDLTEPEISLASIMAKVTRDRYMTRIAAQPSFAPYAFHIHKGYGTQAHREVIMKKGLSVEHRTTYCKNLT